MTTLDSPPRHWFRAKRHGMGYGWGLPLTWEGWLVLAVYVLGITAGALVYFVMPVGPATWVYVGWAFVLSLALVAVCFAKGEPPRAPRWMD